MFDLSPFIVLLVLGAILRPSAEAAPADGARLAVRLRPASRRRRQDRWRRRRRALGCGSRAGRSTARRMRRCSGCSPTRSRSRAAASASSPARPIEDEARRARRRRRGGDQGALAGGRGMIRPWRRLAAGGLRGRLAQWLEHAVHIRGVTGSNPVSPTIPRRLIRPIAALPPSARRSRASEYAPSSPRPAPCARRTEPARSPNLAASSESRLPPDTLSGREFPPSLRRDCVAHSREAVRSVPPLLREPDFRQFWLGQTISVFGDQITLAGDPGRRGAGPRRRPAQMGLLTAVGLLPHLLFSLPAGVWLDRVQRPAAADDPRRPRPGGGDRRRPAAYFLERR